MLKHHTRKLAVVIRVVHKSLELRIGPSEQVKRWRKTDNVEADVTPPGSESQALAAATGNDRSTRVTWRVAGNSSASVVADADRHGTSATRLKVASDIIRADTAEVPVRLLGTSGQNNVNSIRSGTRIQCSRRRSVVMWSQRCATQTRRAAAFVADCRLSRWTADRRASTALQWFSRVKTRATTSRTRVSPATTNAERCAVDEGRRPTRRWELHHKISVLATFNCRQLAAN